MTGHKLSSHFTFDEMTATNTGLPNELSDYQTRNHLETLCLLLLEPIREKWGPLRITSGYRSPAVNAVVGGSKTSQHLLGEAADFVPIGISRPSIVYAGLSPVSREEVFLWLIKESGLKWGQVILEPTWIHISLPRQAKPNQVALTFDGKNYKTWEE